MLDRIVRSFRRNGTKKFELVPVVREEERSINRQEFLRRVGESGVKSNQRDAAYWLARQGEIPQDAREYVLFFPGTMMVDDHGDERMLAFTWNHTVWIPSFIVLAIGDALGFHPNVRLVR